MLFSFAGVPSRSLKRLVNFVELPAFALSGYVAAAFALRCASSEGWWRRRESNPRPKTFHKGIYILIPNFNCRLSARLRAGSLTAYAGKISLLQNRSSAEASLLVDALSGPTGKTRKDGS
jgi:hypothetical protein